MVAERFIVTSSGRRGVKMACPLSALHLPIFLLIFIFPISLSLSSSSSLASSHHSSLLTSSGQKVMYVDPKVLPPPVQQLELNYEGKGGKTISNRFKRLARYNSSVSSGKSDGDGGGGGDDEGHDIVHKLLDGKEVKSNGYSSLDVNNSWDVIFEPKYITKIEEDQEITVTLTTQLKNEYAQYYQIRLLVTEDEWVSSVSPSVLELQLVENSNISDKPLSEMSVWSANFSLKGVFVGFSRIRARLEANPNLTVEGDHLPLINTTSANFLKVSVIRKNSWMDHAFTVSIAILVSVLFVNFGAALDWTVMREALRRPVGPSIGFVTQFLFMPVVSYILGLLLFESPSMRLGLFFTGCSPGGGASNIWTFALGGNLPLSITMTAISTFAAFGMMPFWLFTLGAQIFSSAELSVPYNKIGTFAIALVVPLAIGFLLQRKWPKGANFMVRHILKPLCGFLLIFIVVFAIATNLYIFHLFSWEIILCGMGLPWLGFACGAISARIFSLSNADILAIAIETGVQNTGIAIFMLRFTLGQPLADLTTVVPVSIAIMTPVPLALLWLYKVATGKIRLSGKCNISGGDEMGAQRPLRESTVETINGTMTPINVKV